MVAELRNKHVKIRPSRHGMLEKLARRNGRTIGGQLEHLIEKGCIDDLNARGLDRPRRKRASASNPS